MDVTLAKMMRADKKKAFTLLEVLVTLAIILVLAGALIGTGRYLRVKAERQLTQSAIDVICMALQQYFDQTDHFPPVAGSETDLKTALSVTAVKVSRGTHPEYLSTPDASEGERWWRSESLFYFLDRVPQSKAILNGLSSQILSNKDANGIGLQVEIPTGGTTHDWVRFVDTWGVSLNYTYTAGDVFPLLTSAGPDKKFETTADNIVSQ
jgi:prepilin-type N-terminal cleavage/methylation domain-containing protein